MAAGEDKLKEIINLPYEQFVKELGKWADDPKLQSAILAGKKDGKLKDEKITFNKTEIPVYKLVPTQNEVDMDKSLAYVLSDKSTEEGLRMVMESGKKPGSKPVTIVAPIVVLNEKYVIDGHHRWSQVYAMNKNAVMVVYNIKNRETPQDMLKAVQLAVVSKAKELPVERVEGTNLFNVDEEKLKAYVEKTTADQTLESIQKITNKEVSREELGEYIWGNVQSMRKTSQPIKGAPDRSLMPQTDKAEGGNDDWKKVLNYGAINFKEPMEKKAGIKESRVMDFGGFVNETNKMRIQDFQGFINESDGTSPLLDDLNALGEVKNMKDAETLVLILAKHNMIYHFDDDAREIIGFRSDKEVFSPQEGDKLNELMGQAHALPNGGLWEGLIKHVIGIGPFIVYSADEDDVYVTLGSGHKTIRVSREEWDAADQSHMDPNDEGSYMESLNDWFEKQPEYDFRELDDRLR